MFVFATIVFCNQLYNTYRDFITKKIYLIEIGLEHLKL